MFDDSKELNEAIIHALKVSTTYTGACSAAHFQLAAWLKELVYTRQQLAALGKDTIPVLSDKD